MHDHDQRFKSLIQEFFAEFLQLFFAAWAERFDLSRVEWLDKEVFLDPPQGDVNVLDLVAKLHTRQEVPGQRPGDEASWLALVHIEIESPDKATPLRSRMYRYYHALRLRYGLPVLPIGLFLQVGLDGMGVDVYEEHFWELRPIRFEYLYVGLPALDAVEYLEKDNRLGWALASLMTIPREKAIELGAKAYERVASTPMSDSQRFLLGECLRAYWPLDADQEIELMKLLGSERYSGVQVMNKTFFEEGVEKGIEKGAEQGRHEMLLVVMEERFGPLPAVVLDRLKKMSVPELIELGKRVVRVESLRDLGLDS